MNDLYRDKVLRGLDDDELDLDADPLPRPGQNLSLPRPGQFPQPITPRPGMNLPVARPMAATPTAAPAAPPPSGARTFARIEDGEAPVTPPSTTVENPNNVGVGTGIVPPATPAVTPAASTTPTATATTPAAGGYDLEKVRQAWIAPGLGGRVTLADLQKFLADNANGITKGVTLRGEKLYDPSGRFMFDAIGNFKSGDPTQMTRIALDGIGSNGKPRTNTTTPRPDPYAPGGTYNPGRPTVPPGTNPADGSVPIIPRPANPYAVNARTMGDPTAPGGSMNPGRPSTPPGASDPHAPGGSLNPGRPGPGHPDSPYGADGKPKPKPATGTAPPASNAFLTQIRQQIMDRLAKMGKDPSMDDPALKAQSEVYRHSRMRGAENQRAAMAERGAMNGTISGGQSSGSFDTDLGSIHESASEDIAGNDAALFGAEVTARRNEIQALLNMALQSGDAESARALQSQLAALDAQLRREALKEQARQADMADRYRYKELNTRDSWHNDDYGRTLGRDYEDDYRWRVEYGLGK